MNCDEYLGRVLEVARATKIEPADIVRRLLSSFTLMQEAMATHSSREVVSARMINSYRGILVFMSFITRKLLPVVALDKYGEMTMGIHRIICSDAALSDNQAIAIGEWVRGTGGITKRDSIIGYIHPLGCSERRCAGSSRVLEVFGGSGHNAAVLSLAAGLDVISSDISTIEQPDVAGAETDDEKMQIELVIEHLDKMKRESGMEGDARSMMPRSFYGMHKLDAVAAVDEYASPDTTLFMCMPPARPGIVERTIEHFLAKGGRRIIVIGTEVGERPCTEVWRMLRSPPLCEDANFFSPIGAVPIIPSIVLCNPASFLPSIRLFEVK